MAAMGNMGNKGIAIVEAEKLASDETLVRRSFWRKLRRTLGRIPFTEELLAAYYCATDRNTPTLVKAVLLGAIAYFIIPTDLVPDFIASLGYTDDATVLYAAITAVHRHIKPEHREKARSMLGTEDGEGGSAAKP